MSSCGLTTEDFLIALGDNQNHNFSQMQEMLSSMNQRLASVESKMENVVSTLGQLQGPMNRAMNECSNSGNDQQSAPSETHKPDIQKLTMPTPDAHSSIKSEGDDSNDEKQEPEKLGNEIFCYDCKKSFVRGDGNFTRHLKASLCKPYQCKCGKLFRKKSSLTTHKATHSKATLACYCGSIFRCDQYLKNHQRRVHGSVGKPNPNSSDPSCSKRCASPSEAIDKRSKSEIHDDQEFDPFNLLNLQFADFEV